MATPPSSDENGLKKGPWTPEEDEKLVNYIQKNGHGSWRALPKLAGLKRCGKSCRLRWTNYLRPDIRRGKFSQEEEQTILHLHSNLGNKWSAIARHLPGRTDNEIKNFWNTYLKKKLIRMGIDPMTHRPRTDVFSSLPLLLTLANYLNWDQNALRLQANATQLALLQHLQSLLQVQQASSDVNTLTPNPDTITLLNSLPCINENPVMNSQVLSFPRNPSLLGINDLMHFSHMPDLQIPSSSYDRTSNKDITTQDFHNFTVLSNEEISPNSAWIPPSASSSPPPSGNTNITEASLGDFGDHDIGSGSNNGQAASSLWTEILEDPLFQDLA